MKTDRRRFVRGALGAAGAAALGPGVRSLAAQALGEDAGLVSGKGRSAIEHIVVLMMENRSFDHVLGWLPNADGRQAGLTYQDADGRVLETRPLAPEFIGCEHPDPDHSYDGGRVQFDGGAMDGFLRSGSNDDFSIGYYVEEDRPFFCQLARNYTSLDRSFCSILGPTFPNRFFLHSAQTDRLKNTYSVATMPTIWDRLLDAGVSARYYFSNLPFLALWGAKYLQAGIVASHRRFLVDAERGRLPAVSFVDPPFTVLDDGTGADDHPHADIRRGDAFMARTFHALAKGPAWPSTVFVITYDEWGGFFDHVPPPRAAAGNSVDPDVRRGRARLGFRVPTVVASPFTRGNPDDPRVRHRVFDHTSILKLIEWRFRLAPLTARDASRDVANLASVLDLGHPQVDVPDLPQPPSPEPTSCRDGSAAASDTWTGLRNSPLMEGWDIELAPAG